MILELEPDALSFASTTESPATDADITITPAPMSVSPVAASRIYPLTVYLFCADRLTAKKTANAANVNFRIKFNVLL